MNYFIHATAEVSNEAIIGEGTSVWNGVQIRENVTIGKNCVIGKNTYIDFDVHIGNNCKVQNNSSLYHGLSIADGVFIGPHVVFANDQYPRAITPEGKAKSMDDWIVGKSTVKYGASIGAHSVIVPGVIIETFAMVGAGSVVTKNVDPYTLVYGNPARVHGYVCVCGHKITFVEEKSECDCKRKYKITNSKVQPVNA